MENKEAIQELKSLLSAGFPGELKDVILYRTNISGEDTDYSILIILQQKSNWKLERAISDCCLEIEIKYNILLDVHIIAEAELSSVRGKQPFILQAIEKGIIIS